jgi:putative transposase
MQFVSNIFKNEIIMSEKSEKIKETLKTTKERRKNQVCHVYEIKIDKSKLSKTMKDILIRLFLEAKWFYNAALSSDSFYDFDTKTKVVEIKVDDHLEDRDLTVLSSQMKQSIIERMISSVKTLHTLKLKGKKVGALNFKSFVNSIPLKQFEFTFKILDDKHIHIQNIKESIYVHGLEQLKDLEIANANLIQKGNNYYLKITAYKNKQEEQIKQFSSVGIDFNIEAGCQLVLNNGIALGFNVESHKDNRLKNYQRKLARQDRTNKKQRRDKHTKNRLKTIFKIQDINQEYKNKKNEIRNQIVHELTNSFNKVCHQKESISAWQRIWGKRISGTALAAIIARLDTSSTVKVTDRFVPTTKTCHVCLFKNNSLTLKDSYWVCPNCKTKHNRHINAAINMLPCSERASTSAESLSSSNYFLELKEKFNSIGILVRQLVETDNNSREARSPRL